MQKLEQVKKHIAKLKLTLNSKVKVSKHAMQGNDQLNNKTPKITAKNEGIK